MNLLFTVCGRAGSKGCKNKNVREFLGQPLVKYTISAISLFINRNYKDYGRIDICVNSDSEELLNLAKLTKDDIVCINRNKFLAQDNTPKVDVIKNSVEYCEEINNVKYDIVVDLDITSPLRKVNDIESAIKEKIHQKDKDIIFSVVESRRNPYFNMVQNIDDNYKLIIESTYVTRQQAPTTYDMNASIYVYDRECLSDEKLQTLFEGPCGIVEMIDTGVLDIDSDADFELMEVVAKYFMNKDIEFKEILDNI